jgi:hypothetical protein
MECAANIWGCPGAVKERSRGIGCVGRRYRWVRLRRPRRPRRPRRLATVHPASLPAWVGWRCGHSRPPRTPPPAAPPPHLLQRQGVAWVPAADISAPRPGPHPPPDNRRGLSCAARVLGAVSSPLRVAWVRAALLALFRPSRQRANMGGAQSPRQQPLPVRERWRAPASRRGRGGMDALGTWHLALGTWHLALGTRHSALGTRHSALGTRHSALGTRHSALGTPFCPLRSARARHLRASRRCGNVGWRGVRARILLPARPAPTRGPATALPRVPAHP